MRHLAVALLAVALVFGTTASAQTEARRPGELGRDPPTRVGHIAGQVTGLNGKTLTITATVRGQTVQMFITFNAETQIRLEKATTELHRPGAWRRATKVASADLQVGDQVKVEYNSRNNIALTILITSEPPAPNGWT